jgi:hypothetical protein
MNRTLHSCALVLLLAVSALFPMAPQIVAQQIAPAALPLSKDTVSTTITKNEVPRIALSAGQLHVTWKAGGTTARTAYSQRSEAGGDWPPQQTIGGSSSGSYHTSSVAVSPVDSSVHLIWVDASQGGDGYVFYSRQQSNGQWTSPVRISSVGRFAHFPHVAVDTQGRIWAIWSAENPPGTDNVFYRYSTDNGATWQPSGDGLLDNRNAKRPWIAADRSGGVHAVWWSQGIISYARWTGSNWAIETIPSGGFNADPSVTIDPSGNVHVAWRRQRGFGEWDIYYANRPANSSSWSITRLYEGGNVDKTVVVYADETGTLHLTWFDTLGGAEIWYTTKAPGGNWLSPPQNVSNDGIFNVNPDVVGLVGSRAHVVFETWFGGDADVRIQHVQVGAGGPTGCSGTLVLEGGKEATRNSTVSGVVTPNGCTPDQMQISVDAPPTDATPKVSYSPNISVPIPAGTTCAHTVYVRLFVNGVAGAPAQDTIIVDTSVSANVLALNPHMAGLPTTYTPITINDIRDQGGASDGAPNYTRDRMFFLGVSDSGDCVGLKGFDVEGSIAGAVRGGAFANVVALPGDSSAAPKAFHVVISDTLDNQQSFPSTDTMFQLVYDPADTDPAPGVTNTLGLPVLAPGGSVVGDTNTKSIIRTLTFSNISVTDNLYGQQGENLPAGRQFWGVWVANSRTDVSADDPNLRWYPVRVPVPAASFSIVWNLFSGLDYGPRLDRPGDYFVYVRFLDGAGNPSAGFLKTRLTLDPGYTVPRVNLPLLRR